MPRLVVHCGLCGFEPGIEVEVEANASQEEMRSAVAALVGEPSIQCERCGSMLLPGSGTVAKADAPRLSLARKAQRMERKIRGTRFAVGSPDGPRGGVWRLWVNRGDVYVAARMAASDMKVSLHASGKWRVAFTEQHVSGPNPLIGTDRDRAIDKWDRPGEFTPGWTRAFTIIVPASEIVPAAVVVDPEEVIWIDPLPDGWATVFTVLLSAPGATGTEGRGFATAEGRENFTEVVTSIELETGERVWVLAHAEKWTDEMSTAVEALRGSIPTEAAAAIDEAREDPEPHDIRLFAAGIDVSGTRYFVDVALPEN